MRLSRAQARLNMEPCPEIAPFFGLDDLAAVAAQFRGS